MRGVGNSFLDHLFMSERYAMLRGHFLCGTGRHPKFDLKRQATFTSFGRIASATFIILIVCIRFNHALSRFAMSQIFRGAFSDGGGKFLRFITGGTALRDASFVNRCTPTFSFDGILAHTASQHAYFGE